MKSRQILLFTTALSLAIFLSSCNKIRDNYNDRNYGANWVEVVNKGDSTLVVAYAYTSTPSTRHSFATLSPGGYQTLAMDSLDSSCTVYIKRGTDSEVERTVEYYGGVILRVFNVIILEGEGDEW